MSGLLPLDGVVPAVEPEFSVVLSGANSGLVFILIQIAFLWGRWEKQRRADSAECRSVVTSGAPVGFGASAYDEPR
jgi:hypothetical protein